MTLAYMRFPIVSKRDPRTGHLFSSARSEARCASHRMRLANGSKTASPKVYLCLSGRSGFSSFGYRDVSHYSCRYFVHATHARTTDAEYNENDSEMEAEVTSSPEPEAIAEIPHENMEVDEEVKEEDIDPSLSDWFRVDKGKALEQQDRKVNEDDSETEPDSENEDVKTEEVDIDEADEGWLEIPPQAVSTAGFLDALMCQLTLKIGCQCT